MSGLLDPVRGVAGAETALAAGDFNEAIARLGVRLSWMKGHACPCTFAAVGTDGQPAQPGTGQPDCQTCFGLGSYWDDPTIPFMAWIKYIEMSPTPDEPGNRMDESYGQVQLAEPSLTLPSSNPYLDLTDPQQPTPAWIGASTGDMFVVVDALVRYTAKLQVGGITYLPYQQNVQIEPTGAVAIWDPATAKVAFVQGYTVDGASVVLPTGYTDGTAYMVEFQASPIYVAFRPAGGLPHVRPFGGGIVAEPKRFKLQQLDFWSRMRRQTSSAAGGGSVVGLAYPEIISIGRI